MLQRKKLITIVAAMLCLFPKSMHSQGPARDSRFSFIRAETLRISELSHHKRFMTRAIELARTASGAPFGAVVVNRQQDKVVCEGSNQGNKNPILHGEIVAIMNCSKAVLETPQLSIYTTGEPCSMCFGAITWSGIDQIIYGTSVKTLVAQGVAQVHIDSVEHARASQKFPIGRGSIIGGVLANETDKIYDDWAKRIKASTTEKTK